MCRKLTYLISFVLVLSLATSVLADLQALYTFDDGTVNDSSGNERHGSLFGDAMVVADDELELRGSFNVLELSGAGHVELPVAGGDELLMTWAVWVKPEATSLPGNNHVINDIQRGGWILGSLHCGVNNGYWRCHANGSSALVGATALEADTWYHLAVVRDGTNMIIYVNAQEDGRQSMGNQTIIFNTGFDIGMWNNGRYFLGRMDNVQIYNHALTQPEVEQLMTPAPPDKASKPSPADGATDVLRDVSLSWTPGMYADKHDVYFGTNFDDVNDADRTNPLDVLVSENQVPTSYSPAELLKFGQIYYWRVDEVNAPPDNTIFKGDIWSFTTEPVGYPIAGENITATASSAHQADMGPEKTIDGSGLDDNNLHSWEPTDMWLSSTEPLGAWLEYEFDKVYKLHQMGVWNSNQVIEPLIGFGLKDVTIEYSTNGTDYTTLGTTHEFARAPGTDGYAQNTTVDFGGAVAKCVRLTANSNWGGLPQYGLSEVRFFHIPVRAREPNPVPGATDVDVDVTLSWRAGREAAEHNVYVSSDEQAVADGTAPVTTVTEASYGPLSLDLAQTYYWRISEVNIAETPTTLDGNVWSFTTRESLVVDDFESYNDLDTGELESNRIYLTWIDGYEEPTNGSQVGYTNPPFCERDIVHGGKQSMPFNYDNSTASYSEGTANVANLPIGQDWTKHGIKALSLWFYGDPCNVAQQMYVKLNGSKVTYDGDASNMMRIPWQQWNINLKDFTGVNLSNVTELSIGLERIGLIGGSGVVYFDDVSLTPFDRQLVTPAEPNAAGLVAHYEFEGTTSDSSGNGLHGTVMGNPTFVAGKVGQAINLRGLNDYVEITGYKGILGPNAVTVTAWVKTTATETGTIVGWGPNVSGQRFGFRINASRLRMEHQGGNVQGDTNVNDGGWHHVAVTVQENATISYPEVILYVDGIDDTRPSEDPDAFNLTADQDVRIGSRPSNNDRFFMGLIDGVRIYDRALTPEEIAWLAGRTEPFDKPF